MRNYQQLEVWKVAMQLVQEVYAAAKIFPKEEMFALTAQIKRAAISIPSNIAEGMGRQYKKDTLQFLHIARGSIYELDTQLTIALMNNFLQQMDFDRMIVKLDTVLKLLNGLINYTEKAELK
ncbi:four helix bundle protein [Pseudocnuella soli]|uniref:four helix bundle protein n=1 Tax=Pseudocnuella soli TaxID=2502779 RepID=UPI00104C2F8F|nr:four helix bundle protein [Pseudocnuella soli]